MTNWCTRLEGLLESLQPQWTQWQARGDEADFEALIAPLAELTGDIQAEGAQPLGEIMELACVRLMDAQETGNRPDEAWFPELMCALLALAEQPDEAPDEEVMAVIGALTGCQLETPETEGGVPEDRGEAEPEAPALSAEALSLQPDHQVSADVWRAFMEDTPRHLGILRQRLATWQAGQVLQPETVHACERASHTIKGAAALVGVRGLSTLAHALEDRFEQMAAQPGPLDEASVNLMLETVDTMDACLGSLRGDEPPPANLGALVCQLRGLEAPAELTRAEAEVPQPSGGAVQPPGAAVPALDADTLGPIRRLAEELGVSAVRGRELLRRLSADMALAQLAENQLDDSRYELEKLVDTRSMTRLHRTDGAGTGFDALEMDEYDALHLVTRQTTALMAEMREKYASVRERLGMMETLVRQQSRQIEELQCRVLEGYREPLSRLNPRLERCVRQAARACGKQVALRIRGDSLRIDRQILDALPEPLMHVLRNAVDHGIPDRGDISVAYSTLGHALEICIQDSGPGVDFSRLRQRVALTDPALADAPDAVLLESLWKPGFSTRDQVTELSGRGIGMDAVRQAVTELGGSATLEQPSEGGLCVRLQIPLLRMTEHMLIVEAGGRSWALRSRDLYRILPPRSRTLDTLGSRRVLREEGEDWTWHDLGLRLHGEQVSPDETGQPLLLIRTDAGGHALAVDRILMGEQLTLRRFPETVGPMPGVSGLAVMGDGSLVPVLEPGYWCQDDRTPGPVHRKARARTTLPQVLVVDDSHSVRTTLREVLEDAGFPVLTATDGQDALALIHQHPVQVVVTDLEMPVMDGLALTRQLRAGPDHAGLPVIMLTSRDQPHHRELARHAGVNAYLTKPFDENTLLDTVQEMLTCGREA
ncbi:response regulator [Hahella sp. SMD15-11]|uniref:histidine kinase n=1 Tax=Thermohahella caldifontis TaxID=3142973 RepID=A0AB39UWC8_9GAMM